MMLSLPKKKADRVELTAALKSFVESNYGAEIAADHAGAFAEADQQREAVRLAHDRSDDGGRRLYLSYFVTVSSLERRFPISEQHVRLKFVHYDAFSTRKKTSDFAIHFEKAAVLFNLAAHCSAVGSSQNLTGADGLKAACRAFQAAAGALAEARASVEQHPVPASAADLQPDVLNMAQSLMLAQAQQCFYEKATRDGMKPGITSKLAAQAATFYEQAHAGLGAAATAGQTAWKTQVEMKMLLFRALAHYQTAFVCNETSRYGEQVSRLNAASEILDDAKKRLYKGSPSEVQTSFDTALADVAKHRAQAIKENDTIYHDTVVPSARLDPVEGKAIVKPTPMADQAAEAGGGAGAAAAAGAAAPGGPMPDLFSRLVPFAVTEKVSVYQERKDTLVRQQVTAVDEANQMAIATLSSMNLPGAIEALDSNSGPGGGADEGVPAALITKQESVVQAGGLAVLTDLKATAAALGSEAAALLEAARTALDDEEKDDDAMRQQWGAAWQRTPSHQLTSELRQHLSKHEGHLSHARKSDALVATKLDEHQTWMAQLSGSAADLAAALPRPPQRDASQPSLADEPAVAALQTSLGELDKLVADRMACKAQIQELARDDDPSADLLSAPHDEENIYATRLSKYNAPSATIVDSVSKQGALLERIAAENGAFLQSKAAFEQRHATSAFSGERQAALQAANAAHATFHELLGNIREAVTFYTDFQGILTQLKSRCTDFALTRDIERKDFLRRIQSQAAGGGAPGGGGTAAAPPAAAAAPAPGAAPSAYQHLQQQPQQQPQQPQPQPQQPAAAYNPYPQQPGAALPTAYAAPAAGAPPAAAAYTAYATATGTAPPPAAAAAAAYNPAAYPPQAAAPAAGYPQAPAAAAPVVPGAYGAYTHQQQPQQPQQPYTPYAAAQQQQPQQPAPGATTFYKGPSLL